MKRAGFWIVFLLVSLISLNAAAQDPMLETQEMEIQEPAQVTAPSESDTQWLWGEVGSLDIMNNEITVNYFDYETDTENRMAIVVDDNTIYENISSLSDINLNDTISVDYALSPDGKYIAKNISIETPEEIPLLAASTTPPEIP